MKYCQLEDIHIRYLDFTYENSKGHALSQLTTTIPKGSFIGLVSKPGSGKSTLFKLLIGLQECPEKSHLFWQSRFSYCFFYQSLETQLLMCRHNLTY